MTTSLSAVLVLLLAGCGSPQPAPRAAPAVPAAHYVLPPPKQARSATGVFVVTAHTPIQDSGSVDGAELLKQELLAGASAGAARGSIVLEKIASWSALGRDLGREGYVLDVAPDGVHAQAIDAAGLYYAAQTLLQLADRSAGATTIAAVHIVDWPDVNDRMVLYDLRFDNVNMAYMKRWIHELSRMKVNQLMLFLSGDYQYEKYPFVASDDKLTRDKLRELKRYAAAHHVQLVPQVESLGHGEGILKHDQFREIRLGDQNTYAYSPCTPKTYAVLGDLYSELARELDQSDLFHVGGDEIWDFQNDPRCKVAAKDERAQSQLYSQHMQRLTDLLHPLHRRLAVWGDMILKHRAAAEGLSRDTVIFDWDYSEDYKRFDDFPSLKVFKSLGFHDIYATAAVLGFNDMYPLLPVAFQNIRGFTQAALREQIRSVCVTMWEMQPGNNAENYLYGLSWAGNITWSSQATSLEDFNRRFAAVWFGIRDDTASKHIDRMFWFPWRVSGDSKLTEKDTSGFWQIEHRTAELLYMPFDKFVAFHPPDDLARLAGEAEQLLRSLDVAAASIEWLDKRNTLNQQTIQSLQMSNVFYRFLAEKVRVLAMLSTSYRDAYASHDRGRALEALGAGVRDLKSLSPHFVQLKKHLKLAVDERNRSPDELKAIDESIDSAAKYAAQLAHARSTIEQGSALPAPLLLGLEPTIKKP